MCSLNAPKVIWMINDLGGFIRVSENYLWVQFSGKKEREFRINALEIYSKIQKRDSEIPSGDDFAVFLNISKHDGEETSVIYLERSNPNYDQVEISTYELVEALRFFVG